MLQSSFVAFLNDARNTRIQVMYVMILNAECENFKRFEFAERMNRALRDTHRMQDHDVCMHQKKAARETKISRVAHDKQ